MRTLVLPENVVVIDWANELGYKTSQLGPDFTYSPGEVWRVKSPYYKKKKKKKREDVFWRVEKREYVMWCGEIITFSVHRGTPPEPKPTYGWSLSPDMEKIAASLGYRKLG